MPIDRRTLLSASAVAAAAAPSLTVPAAARAEERREPKPPGLDETPPRIVTLEEHFIVQSLMDEYEKARMPWPPGVGGRLNDLGDGRLRNMDEAGITVQVLSSGPGADFLDGADGIDFARRTNDHLYAAVRQHPNRYAGFAHLPMRSPEAAADELERTVKQLGYRGALIHGTTEGRFLDDARFAPILARAEALDVPIYIHPKMPPKAVYDAYYSGLLEQDGGALAAGIFGWHSEVGIHVLRMVLAGTFDKHPKLKVIIGHMGEMLPFMLDRADDMMANMLPNVLERSGHIMKSTLDEGPVTRIIMKHVYITTSGFFSTAALASALATFGPDRILFSVDYPFSSPLKGTKWLEGLALPAADRRKIRSENADKLLKLGPVA